MSDKYFVYVLYSEKSHQFYIGQTNNLFRRIEEHNRGRVNATKHISHSD